MAKRFFRTERADRPDLAAIGGLTQADLKGYAFAKLFPILAVSEKSGTMTVAPAGLSEAQGVTGRANGTALAKNQITMVDVPWAARRVEGRGALYEDDGAAYATPEAADQAGAELAQRLAWNTVENTAFAKVFTAERFAGATSIATGTIKALQAAAKKLRKYGKPSLVMTTNAWLSFVELDAVQKRLEKFALAGSDPAFLAGDFDRVRAVASTLIGFEDVVLFDSDIVDAAGAYDNAVGIVALRPDAAGRVLETAKSRALYGFTVAYIPEDATADKPFDMRSYYSDDDKCNVYDAEAFVGVTEVFADAVVMCTMQAQG